MTLAPPQPLDDSLSGYSSTDTSSYHKKPGETRYVHWGIGGAGNYKKSDPSVARLTKTFWRLSLNRCKTSFSTGIGGSGNIRAGTQAAALSSNEQAIRARAYHERAPDIYHFGIGGMGNQARRGHVQTIIPSLEPRPIDASPLPSEPSPQYSDQPLRIGAADRLAAKLFGIRKHRPAQRIVRHTFPMTEHRHESGRVGFARG